MTGESPRQPSGGRRPWIVAAALVLLLAGAACASYYYYHYDPSGPGLFPQCAFHRLSGWQCPGCGLQRAFHDLLHARFLEALGHNFLAPWAIALALWHGLTRLARRWGHKKLYSPLDHPQAGRVALVAVIAFFVLRNL